MGKWAGLEFGVPGGIGAATLMEGDVQVSALAVVNSVGDVLGPDGAVIAGTTAPDPRYSKPPAIDASAPSNTVLAVVATQAALDKREVRWVAARGSDGIAVAVRPAHTRYDGDVVFAIASPPEPQAAVADLDVIGMLATQAVAAAVRDAVT